MATIKKFQGSTLGQLSSYLNDYIVEGWKICPIQSMWRKKITLRSADKTRQVEFYYNNYNGAALQYVKLDYYNTAYHDGKIAKRGIDKMHAFEDGFYHNCN